MSTYLRKTVSSLAAALLTCVSANPLPGQPAQAQVSEICVNAAQKAAKATGVPVPILIALTKTETGRGSDEGVKPWPWTINSRGQGTWLSSQAELLDAALQNLANHITSFDVGCFQINHRWHSEQFDSLDQMTDPEANAIYAARFLRSLFVEFGNWHDAVGAYHSRTPNLAANYLERFLYNLGQEPASKNTSPAAVKQMRPNAYPLLIARTASVARGSLVPELGGMSASVLGAIVRQ